MSWIKIALVAILSQNSFAQEPQFTALSFKSWKEQQILEAQNQVLRDSNHLNQIKSGHVPGSDNKEPLELPSGRVRKASEGDLLNFAERDLRRAQDELAAAKALKFEDYANVYIPTLQDQPEALSKVTERLSKDELVEVVKSLVKRSPKPYDAKRNNASLFEPSPLASPAKGL